VSDDLSKLPFMNKAHVIPEPAFTIVSNPAPTFGRQFERMFPGEPCYYCGGVPNSVDHVIPRSKGGDDTRGNLVPSCFRCNQMKSNLTMAEFVAHLEKILKTLSEKSCVKIGSKKVIQAGKGILQCPLAA
jgi:HNH endonuclease